MTPDDYNTFVVTEMKKAINALALELSFKVYYDVADRWNKVEGYIDWLRAQLEAPMTEDDLTVCIVHRSFIPCRHGSICVYSSEQEDVETVRKWQQPEHQ